MSDKPNPYVPGRVSSDLGAGASSWLRSEFNSIRNWAFQSDSRALTLEELASNAAVLVNNRGWRNWLLNCNFVGTERGTLWISPNTGTTTAERWKVMNGGFGQTFQISTIALNPTELVADSGAIFRRYLNYKVTATGPNDGDYMRLSQMIEDVRHCHLKPVTISAYFRSRSATADNIRFYVGPYYGYGGSARSWEASPLYPLPNDGVWRRIFFSTTMPSIVGKSLASGNGVSCLFEFSQGGKTFDIDMTGAQYEYASEPSEFEQKPLLEEMEALMRYYWHTAASTNPYNFQVIGLCPSPGNLGFGTTLFPVTMMGTPTVQVIGQSILSTVTGGTIIHVANNKSWRPVLQSGTGGTALSPAAYIATDVQFDAEMDI